MKTDKEWGEIMGGRLDRMAFVSSPIALRVFIRRIQADALRHAACVVNPACNRFYPATYAYAGNMAAQLLAEAATLDPKSV